MAGVCALLISLESVRCKLGCLLSPLHHPTNNTMKDTMKTKHTTLAAALCAAQAEMKNPPLNAVNPHFRNRYANLAAVRDAVITPLNAHGVTVLQNVVPIEGGIGIETLVWHESATEPVKYGPLPMPASKQDAQGYGSAITYGCRYALCALFGVVGEDDDDGEAAVKVKVEAAKPIFKKIASAAPSAGPSAAQRLVAQVEQSGIKAGVVMDFLHHKKSWPLGCERIEDLPANVCERLLNGAVWATVLEFSKNEVQS